MNKKPNLKAPAHLAKETGCWWEAVIGTYVLEAHHIRLLTLAAEAWDRGQAARAALDEHGLTYLDRFNQPRVRPEVGIERDCRIGFARMVRELQLDVDPPMDPRIPRLP